MLPRYAPLIPAAIVVGLAVAQTPAPVPPPSVDVAYALDSGVVSAEGDPLAAQTVYQNVVLIPDAAWLRLRFSEVTLAGDPAANGSFLRITSLEDGHAQVLNAEHAGFWNNQSATFNGGVVLLELLAYGGTGPNQIVLDTVVAGEFIEPLNAPADLCGADDRVLSDDPRAGRFNYGCTVWMFDDINNQFMTAGHCGTNGATVWFNVPLSDPDGSSNAPPVEDQYPIDALSSQGQNAGIGNDWRYFGTLPNSNTGLQPFQRQGAAFETANAPEIPDGVTIRITGYGVVNSPVSPTWNNVQKTHAGPMTSLAVDKVRYLVDTTGNNSGSPVIWENQGKAVGVHTHAGCGSGGNQGTAWQDVNLQNGVNAPKGICQSGVGSVSAPLYVIGDLANNFGTLNLTSGLFGKISQDPLGRFWQGMAYRPDLDAFYAINTAGELWTIDAQTGAHTEAGPLSGIGLTINGLAFDPGSGTLYGISQADGQLYSIDAATLIATPIGAPGGGTVGGIEFDPSSGTLFGLSDLSGGTRLISISTTTGAQTVIGILGAGATDCNGLAYVDSDDNLYTINSGNDQLLRISKTTGLATSVGATLGSFGSAFGMAAAITTPPCVGDIDNSGATDQLDLNILLSAYNTCAGDPGYNGAAAALAAPTDCVDQLDLNILLSGFGCQQ